jgi:ParB-like chromosome segregation protein Spo0J
MKLKLTEVKLDSGLQARAALSESTVQEYTEVIREGGVMPAVTVFHDGTEYHLADGWHRYFAHKSAGFPEIEADIKEGTRRDAILYAVSANDKHGLRRSNADKRKAVLVLLEDFEWSEWNDVKIATQCGVSSMFVGKLRKEINGDEVPAQRIVKRGDKEFIMNTDKIGRVLEKQDPAPEYDEEDKLEEMATEFNAIAQENEELRTKLALQIMDGTPEEKKQAQAIIEEQAERIKSLEAQVKGLTASRDAYQLKNAELIKQVNYWKKQAQK